MSSNSAASLRSSFFLAGLAWCSTSRSTVVTQAWPESEIVLRASDRHRAGLAGAVFSCSRKWPREDSWPGRSRLSPRQTSNHRSGSDGVKAIRRSKRCERDEQQLALRRPLAEIELQLEDVRFQVRRRKAQAASSSWRDWLPSGRASA